MKNDLFVIIDIPFNYLRLNDNRLTKDWILRRMDIFFKTALKSFKCQTNQNFEVIVGCVGKSMDIINEGLHEREQLPKNIHFVDYTLTNSLVKQIVKDYERFYLVSIDSDNLYRKDFIQLLYDLELKPDTEALLCQRGYLFDLKSSTLAYTRYPSPSFNAFIYKTSDYLEGKLYKPVHHTLLRSNFNVEILEDYYYIITITGENKQFNESFLIGKKIIEGEDKEKVLHDFGLMK